jgi:Tol biopolymer transport system component
MSNRRTIGATLATGVIMSLTAALPAHATFPGADGLIVFSADTGSGSQLYTVRPDGSGLTQIGNFQGDAVNPDWSPDGRHIVFELDSEDGCSVMITTVDGSHAVNLTSGRAGPGCDVQPSYLPDGQHVVFERFDFTTEVDAIWTMDINGGHRVQLHRAAGSGGVTDPNVSPDGSTISYIDANGSDLGQGVATMHRNGNNAHDIVPFTVDAAIKHDWGPDGQTIAFTNHADDETQSANIDTVKPDGSGLRELTRYSDPAVRAYLGSYSPDGHWIVYRLEDHGLYSLVRMPAAGGEPVTILGPSTLRPRYIDWGTMPDRS